MSLGQPSTLPGGGQYSTMHTGWPPDASQAGTTIYTPGSATSQQSSESVCYFSGASSISSAGSMAAPPAMNISIYNFNYSSSPLPPSSFMHRSSVTSGHNSNYSSSPPPPSSFMHRSSVTSGHNSNYSSSPPPPSSFMHRSSVTSGHNSNCSLSPPPPSSFMHRSSVTSGHNSNCSSSSSLPHSFMHCNHDGNPSLSSSPPYPLMCHSHTDHAQARSRIHNTRGKTTF